MTPDRDPRPLIAHVVYRFDVGGLENGVVNLIPTLLDRFERFLNLWVWLFPFAFEFLSQKCLK